MTDSDTKKVTLVDVIQAEVKSLASISTGFQQKIKEAKTTYKQSFYKKKLKKNNEKLFEMLVALNKATEDKKTTDATPTDEQQ